MDKLSFSIYGAENMVDSYLDYDGYDYDYYRESRVESVQSVSEIEYIFDRDWCEVFLYKSFTALKLDIYIFLWYNSFAIVKWMCFR